MRKRHYLIAGLALSMMVSTEAQDARACGGTFCDSGPQAMPVDQSGENVLFVMDGKTVEAHVQIQYQGAAERFAWIVPMPKVPDVQVGSALLFNALLQGTVPQFGFTQQTDVCDRGNSDSASGAGGSGGGSLGMGGAAGGAGSGPQVVYEKTVGAFEVVVLQGGTAEEVGKWLVDNNYQNIPTAPEILKDYVAQKYVFVAIKLTAGANSNEIHPLVFRYEGDEPCVPLKLTRVAATEDMAVRTFFLGDDRVVPTNFKHVTLNPARIDWSTMGQNYRQVVSRAVDSPVANGKAFVTEYAGASSVVGQFTFYNPSWNSQALEGIDPTELVSKLEQMGLLLCSPYRYYSGDGDCQYNHPLVKALLTQYLPVPAGLSPAEFYGALAQHADEIDMTQWNLAELAADFKLRIQDPAKHASEIVSKWPYLTRLFTTISPSEMTEDPMFHAHPGLDPVQPLNMAVRRTNCCGASSMDLGDTEIAYDKTTGSWPVWDSAMPFAQRIDEFSLAGDRITLVDNGSKISGQIAAWNTENKQTCFPPGAKKAASDDTEDMLELAGGAACGVSGRGSAPAAAFALALLGLAALVRQRR